MPALIFSHESVGASSEGSERPLAQQDKRMIRPYQDVEGPQPLTGADQAAIPYALHEW